jgi:hypothetical protein
VSSSGVLRPLIHAEACAAVVQSDLKLRTKGYLQSVSAYPDDCLGPVMKGSMIGSFMIVTVSNTCLVLQWHP